VERASGEVYARRPDLYAGRQLADGACWKPTPDPRVKPEGVRPEGGQSGACNWQLFQVSRMSEFGVTVRRGRMSLPRRYAVCLPLGDRAREARLVRVPFGWAVLFFVTVNQVLVRLWARVSGTLWWVRCVRSVDWPPAPGHWAADPPNGRIV
jgi:hypothetical protein